MQKLDNQYFTYRTSPANQDGNAQLRTIKGNTLVFNQLVQNGNFVDTSVWQNYGSTFSVSENIATVKSTNASNQFGIYQPFTLKANHKYFISFEVKKYGTITLKRNRLSSGQEQIQEGLYKTIETASADLTTSSALRVLFGEPVSDINADYFTLKNYIIIDLTQMFGAGNEPTSVSDFTDLFPLSYYDYNAGSLLSFNGTGLKTTGKNLLTYSGEKLPYNANGVSITRENNIYKVVANNPSGYPFTRISTIPYLRKGQYTITMLGTETSNTGIGWRLIDRNVSPVKLIVNASTTTTTFILNEDLYDIYFEITIDASRLTTNTWDVRFALEKGTQTDYEPYTENTIDLPISTYFPNGMRSAGEVYDELTESKATTRIGMVDLGTLDWTYTNVEGHLRFVSSTISPEAKLSANNAIANAVCAKYEIVTEGNVYNNQKVGLCIITNSRAMVYDPNFSDATTFKTAMSGVYLYYELATPVETEIDPVLFLIYESRVNGVEELLPANTGSPITTPLLADIWYSSGYATVVTHPEPISGGITSGDGYYLIGDTATINAIANEHYMFRSWQLDGEIVSTDSEYSFEVENE